MMRAGVLAATEVLLRGRHLARALRQPSWRTPPISEGPTIADRCVARTSERQIPALLGGG